MWVRLLRFECGVHGLDLVVTFRDMHNFTPEGRANINDAVFTALKPGGLYGVVDHSRRHMEPMTAENRRRADVVRIIRETQARASSWQTTATCIIVGTTNCGTKSAATS